MRREIYADIIYDLKIFSSDLKLMNTREKVICFGQVKLPNQQNACIYTSDIQKICVYIYIQMHIFIYRTTEIG